MYLQLIADRELVPRTSYNIVVGTLCEGLGAGLCDTVFDILFGPSENQRNYVNKQH